MVKKTSSMTMPTMNGRRLVTPPLGAWMNMAPAALSRGGGPARGTLDIAQLGLRQFWSLYAVVVGRKLLLASRASNPRLCRVRSRCPVHDIIVQLLHDLPACHACKISLRAGMVRV